MPCQCIEVTAQSLASDCEVSQPDHVPARPGLRVRRSADERGRAFSLIPFTTAWLASSRVAALPQTVYAAVFLLVKLTYIVLMRETFRQSTTTPEQQRSQRIHFLRAWIMVAVFAFAACAVFVPAGVRLALTATFLLVHVRPNLWRTSL